MQAARTGRHDNEAASRGTAGRNPRGPDTDCSGAFDPATGRYTDILNIGDASWHLAMRRGTDGTFSMETLQPRGAAQTSLWLAREAGASLDAAQLHALMRDPQGKTLEQQLAPETFAQVGDYLRANWHLPIDVVNAWSAQMFVSAFSYGQLERRHGVNAGGVDYYLAQRARGDGKQVEGLESAASQYAVLQAMDEGHEDELMLSLLEAATSNADIADFDRLVRLWRSGDTATLNREDIAPMRANDYADYQLIQVRRNEAWLPRIEALLQTPQTEMIVVGVAHMVGSDGLIARLRQRGYHVEKY